MASVPTTFFESDGLSASRDGFVTRLRVFAVRFAHRRHPAPLMDRQAAADADYHDRFYG